MRRESSKRGTILLGVMVVVVMAALAGTTAMYLAQAELAASRTALKRVQTRAMAWSGVQAAMAEMADQREKLLDGQAPELTQRWEMFAEEGGPRGVVRLVASVENGPLAESEGAKLDLNTATAEMLGKIGLNDAIAKAVIAARDRSRFSSVGDLTRIEGFDPGLLERAVPADGSPAQGSGAAAPPASVGRPADPSATPSLGLADLVTVFSFDPNIQSGLGDNGSDHRGQQRVSLRTQWSDRLAAALDDRFGKGSSDSMKPLFDRGAQFKTLGEVAAAANLAGLPQAGWGPIFDALTITDDPYLIGRVDLNRASASVLASIPGISLGAADQIVQMRDKLDADAKATICWPLIQGVLKPDEFAKAVDHLSTRSMQWRVRVEAGMAPPGDGSGADRGDEVLTDRVELEAVIDVASEQPRVAYLRDVTLVKAMVSVYAASRRAEKESDDGFPEQSPTGPVGATGSSGEQPPGGPHMDTDLHLSSDLSMSSGTDQGSGDLNLGGTDPGSPIDKGTSDSPSASDGPSPSVPPSDPGVDRRVGRWTTGGAGGSGAGG